MIGLWCILVGLAFAVVVIYFLRQPVKKVAREARFAQARKGFHRQREWLEAKLLHLAMVNARPDAPRWTDCEFDDAISYVRHRKTGELSAFVAVTVALEGIGQRATTGAELIGNLRAGTAVFRFDKDHWETDGRVILNLTPREAVRFYQGDLEIVGQELVADD